MLDFIPDEIIFPDYADTNRVFKLNNKDVVNGDIIYIITREFRLEDNWAFVFASKLALKYNKNLKVIIFLNKEFYSQKQYNFMINGLDFFKKNLEQNYMNYEVLKEIPQGIKPGAIIVDFNIHYIKDNLWPFFLKKYNCALFEVDSHNIIPARYISDKQEFSAATLRRKVYANIANFLTEFPKIYNINNCEATTKLNDFIQNKLNTYSQNKNDPNKNVTSGLSPYLHFGFISAQRIAIEIINSNASRDNKEAYLEELIVRKELSDNFCLYCNNFKSFECIPRWAKETLNSHNSDIRAYLYNKNELENGKTHDEFWNKMQQNLVRTGKIHGYLRMYWAKKILEWSKSPEDALDNAIYLNDKYALDGNDPNGYTGILWSIGGVHDRPFLNRMITGKIRYMSLDSCKTKFDVKKYINN